MSTYEGSNDWSRCDTQVEHRLVVDRAAAGRKQQQAAGKIGPSRGKMHSDRASNRMRDDDCSSDLQTLQDVLKPERLTKRAVFRAVQAVAVAVAGPVERDKTMARVPEGQQNFFGETSAPMK